jgi:hypothetical protein
MAWIGVALVGGNLLGGWLGSRASGKAADVQSDAANYSSDLAYKSGQEALGFQRDVWNQQRSDMAPWQEAGKTSLSDLMASRDELTRPFGASDFQADPGYAFRQSEGQRGIEGSAAARGGSLSGGAVKDAMRFNSGLASEEYGNAFNRFNINQGNRFNRLAAIAGIGQTANQQLGQAGQSFATNSGNIVQNTANSMGDAATQGANARASGYVGGANAWSGALSGATNSLSQYYQMLQLKKIMEQS